MEYNGKTLDRFQEEAIAAIEKNHSVVVSAPTGSGKTLIADYIISKDVERGIRVIYTAPIKALSNQKYKEFSAAYGEANVGLLTGDVIKNPSARVLIMTTEIYRNMAITRDELVSSVSYVVFDEIHYINDIERGYVWEESIIFSKPHVRFLCLSATIPNAREFADWIQAIKGHVVQVIRHDTRYVPLHKSFYDSELGITSLESIKEISSIPDYRFVKGRSRQRMPRINPPSHIELLKAMKHQLPCFFFVFSRQKCQEYAIQLTKQKLFASNPRISALVRERLSNAVPEVQNLASTRLLRQTLPFGIGFHHAGLIPIMKDIVESLFADGLLKVLYTTETFAVGINMPAKSVCFESLRKFDGNVFRYLHAKEFFQIAGRAGRRGIDNEGFVYSMINRRDFNYRLIKVITGNDTEKINSQFRLSVNTVLNLIYRHDEKEIDIILRMNFHTFQRYGNTASRSRVHYTFRSMRGKLSKLGYADEKGLTAKGIFASKIYADEILTAEIFATGFYQQLNEYQMLLLMACICYEGREKSSYDVIPSKDAAALSQAVKSHHFLQKHRRFDNIIKVTAFMHPCYNGVSIFEIIRNTGFPEGDILRFFRQIIDRLSQIRIASEDPRLRDMLENVRSRVVECLKDIDGI